MRQPSGGFELTSAPPPVRSLLADVWRARDVLLQLSRREFRAKYRRATFGIAWAVLLPVVQAVVLAAVVRRFVRFETESDYALFVLTGTVAWSFLTLALVDGASSVVDNSHLSAKIYFPRAVFPLSAVGSSLYGLVAGIAVLVGFAVAAGETPGMHTFALPGAALVLVLLTAAGSLLAGGLHVYFRDVKYVVQAGLIPAFYLTPIFYPLEAVGDLRPWIEANPMTGVVGLFRLGVLDDRTGLAASLAWTGGWTVVLAVAALAFHRRYDRVMSDLL